MANISQLAACAFCPTAESHPVQRGVRNRPDMDVVRCSGCGLVRLSPMPDEAELARYYADSYREAHEPGLEPEGAYRNELPEARRRVERLSGLLGPAKSLLELGASSGAFVDSASPFLKEAVGIEPSKRHREWARATLGLEMLPGLEAAAGRQFDVIVLFHVLEHVRHPVPFLRALSERLAAGGRLVIEVPNVDDALLSVYKVPAFSKHYFQDAHLWYFSGATLGRALDDAGLTHRVGWIQRYDLSNHLHWLGTGEPGGKGRYAEILGATADTAYGEALCRARVSDTLWAVAHKERK